MVAPPVKRRLTVTGQREVYHGVKNDREYTIYEVDAVDAQGQPITEKLKCFERLPEGEPIEVSVARRETEKYGVEYTLKRPKGSQQQEVISRLDDHEERLRTIEGALGR